MHLRINMSTLRNRIIKWLLLGVWPLAANVAANGQTTKPAPYPDALADADVLIADIQPERTIDNLRNGPVVGNGEMNAIVYVAGKDLMLRVSKNDAWDGRVDTSEDPALPRVDPATHKLFREKPGNPPSWNKPYPCAVPCADIKLQGLDGETGWQMNLSLARAVAAVSTSAGKTDVRALAQANVFYVRGRQKLELLGVSQKFLPAATQGTAEPGISWLCQRIPGDEDVKALDIYLAAAADGERQAVAVVTSAETSEPLQRAVALVRATLARSDAEVVAAHDAVWADYWAESGVRLSERQFQNWWYRMVYYFRCFAKKGASGVGLKTSFDSLAGWHNSYKFNYNIQQTYLSAGPINHPELVEPIIDVLANYWPRARWFAATCFSGCEGGFVHSDVYHPHEPDPAVCKSKNRHQSAYIPWGYSLGMQGHIAFLLWEYHQYKPDADYLRAKTYPMLRDIALFYCSFLEKCKKDERGKIVVGPSYFPENGYFGQDNGAYDLAYIPYALKAARDAAGVLKTDDALVRRINAVLADLPPFETLPDPSQENKPVVIWHQGGEFPNDDRHGSLIQAVFPAGQVTWFSPKEEQELFKRTINLVGKITTHANSPVTLNIARARLGMTDEAWANIAVDFTQHHKELRNGLFAWKAHGNYISEQVGVARLISELLLQSVDNVIRVFPAWPKDKDAAFARLRAQGGFLVSAQHKDGTISGLVIESTAGGTARLVSPWGGKEVRVLEQKTQGPVPVSEGKSFVSFPTEAGGAYIIVPQ
jgi:alpha-L-fucosidase 2